MSELRKQFSTLGEGIWKIRTSICSRERIIIMNMDFSSIYHRASDHYCYALDEDHLIINLKTGYDITKVFIHYGDPYSYFIEDKGDFAIVREEIITKKKLQYHLWWTTIVKPGFKRCRYFFELVCEDQTYYYFENNFFTKEQIDDKKYMLQFFVFPWMNKSDINVVPKWVNDTVWYQIMPDRFANGDPSINREGTKPWKYTEEYTHFDFYGGDLQGIINKLDYLKALGITGIYLTPINDSLSYHRYNTSDYYTIDPYLGNSETLKTLVIEAHARDIRIMLDAVFNHSGDMLSQWQDVIKKGEKSKYYDWFMVNKWPFIDRVDSSLNTINGNYYSFSFMDFMPKLNTNNPEVVSYLLDLCEYWIKEFDIDGLRLDVASEISHTFLRELRNSTKSLKADFYILGEIWNNSMPWLLGDQFDSVMNYPLADIISNFFVHRDLTKENFEYYINRCYTMYMQQTNDVLFNFLDSHDTIRMINMLEHNLNQMYQQLGILFTMPGSVCIYYGTEIAVEGADATEGRRCMPWDKIETGEYDNKIAVMKRLINMRKNNEPSKSRHINFTHQIPNKRVIEYVKTDEAGKKIEVIANCSTEEIQITDHGSILFSNLYDCDVLKPDGIVIRRV